MMDIVFELAFNLMEYWIFILLIQYICAADINLSRKNSAIGMGIAAAAILVAAILLGKDWAYIAMYLSVFLTIFLFAGKKRNAFLRFIPAFIIYFTLTVIPGAMLDILFSVRDYSPMNTMLLQAGIDIVLLVPLIILRYVVRKHRIIVCFGAKECIGSIVLFFFTYIDGQLLALMNRQNHEPAVHYAYAALFIVIYIVSVVYYMYSLARMWQQVSRQTKIGAEMEYMKIQLASLDDMKEKNEKTQQMRHDQNKHMAVIKMLCDEGKYDEVSKYVKQLSSENIQSGIKLLTGNEIVDLVAAQKKKICGENGIGFTFDGLLGGMGDMTDPDICGLFANAYDNAIEACITQTGAYIRTSVHATRNYTVIEIANSVAKKVSVRKNSVPSSKEKKNAHGYGMEIMKQIARKYNGNCTFSCDEKEFKVKIVLLT